LYIFGEKAVKMSKIIDAVTALAEPVVLKHECQLWDVEFVKEAGDQYLRIYIDRADGVSITHCEAVSRELDPLLDEIDDIIPGSYTFEVSSAGAERRLHRPSDFERFMGHLIEVKLYKSRAGSKSFIGNLTDFRDGDIEIDISGVTQAFEKAEIANVRLRIQ
jgi:ribosome maturation factor RimP